MAIYQCARDDDSRDLLLVFVYVYNFRTHTKLVSALTLRALNEIARIYSTIR